MRMFLLLKNVKWILKQKSEIITLILMITENLDYYGTEKEESWDYYIKENCREVQAMEHF